MRQYGTAVELMRRTGGGELVTTYVDGPFTDDNVDIYPIGMTIPSNDRLEVTCTYTNNGPMDPIRFSDGAFFEECMLATYVAPAPEAGIPIFSCVAL